MNAFFCQPFDLQKESLTITCFLSRLRCNSSETCNLAKLLRFDRFCWGLNQNILMYTEQGRAKIVKQFNQFCLVQIGIKHFFTGVITVCRLFLPSRPLTYRETNWTCLFSLKKLSSSIVLLKNIANLCKRSQNIVPWVSPGHVTKCRGLTLNVCHVTLVIVSHATIDICHHLIKAP